MAENFMRVLTFSYGIPVKTEGYTGSMSAACFLDKDGLTVNDIVLANETKDQATEKVIRAQ